MESREYFEGIGDLVIATLASSRSVKHFRFILRDRGLKRYKQESIRVALSRLKKKEYIKNSSSGWFLTKRGKERQKNKRLFEYFPSPFFKNSPPNTMISFDVPIPKRILRNWLRNQIKIFGYQILQQSLWTGPGPLPENFLKRLGDFGIRKHVKIFRIRRGEK